VEKAAQNRGGAVGFTSPRAPALLNSPKTALTATVAGYTGPMPMDLSMGKMSISVEERAKRFADGRCLYCGGFNHRVAECVVRKKVQMFMVAGVDIKEVETREGSEESGKESINPSRMALWLMGNGLF